MKVSDLPEFSAVLDAHGSVLGADLDYEADDDGETGTPALDEPVARQWLEALGKGWEDSSDPAPYIRPLAKLIPHIGALSGVPVPELDRAEDDLATAVMTGGFDDEA